MVAAVLVLALAGCAADDSTTGSPQPETTSVAAAGAVFGAPAAEIPLGKAKMIVESDGAVFTIHADGGDEELTVVVTGDRVTVTGGSYCPDPAASSTYRWSRSGETLTVTPIDNDCPDRQAVLAGTWQAA
jgi:ribosomal protein L13